MNTPYLSVVFCVWNEEKNITGCLDDAFTHVPPLAGERGFEIIVIDNASTDATPAVVGEYAKTHPQLRLIRHPENRLYAGSYRTAFTEAKGTWTAIIDGDHQHTTADIADGLRLLEQRGCDVVFGWKQTRHDPLMRKIFTVGLRRVSARYLNHGLHDINCGYRLFSRKALGTIAITEKINATGPEIYCEARRNALTIGELTVRHFARAGGTGLFDKIWPMLRGARNIFAYIRRLSRRYDCSRKAEVVRL